MVRLVSREGLELHPQFPAGHAEALSLALGGRASCLLHWQARSRAARFRRGTCRSYLRLRRGPRVAAPWRVVDVVQAAVQVPGQAGVVVVVVCRDLVITDSSRQICSPRP